MKNFYLVLFIFFSVNSTAHANRGYRSLEARDIKSPKQRSEMAKRIYFTVRDLTGSDRFSRYMQKTVNEVQLLDIKSQNDLLKAINATMKGLEASSRNEFDQALMNKIESVVTTSLDAAITLRSFSVRNKQIDEVTSLLFLFGGIRVKEKLENPQIPYDLDKMQRIGEIVLFKAARKKILTEADINEIYRSLEAELNRAPFVEVVKTKG